MRIPRAYIDHPLQTGAEFQLDRDTAHYLATVLRLQAGRPVILFNGLGGEFSADIVAADRKTVRVRVGEQRADTGVSPLDIELAIAISRGERFEWVVQKATELGVAGIQPLWSERVEVRLDGPRLLKKLDHWRRIAISASEQSGRTRLPELSAPLALHDYLDQVSSRVRLLLHPAEAGSLDQATGAMDPASGPLSISLLVGPEGGWDEVEVETIRNAGFQPWQLGPRILRTETAPVAALAVLQHRFGDG